MDAAPMRNKKVASHQRKLPRTERLRFRLASATMRAMTQKKARGRRKTAEKHSRKAPDRGETCSITMAQSLWESLRGQAKREDRTLRSVFERTIRAGLEALVTS